VFFLRWIFHRLMLLFCEVPFLSSKARRRLNFLFAFSLLCDDDLVSAALAFSLDLFPWILVAPLPRARLSISFPSLEVD